jgi:UDP:flavonoid glycosyltransferase YjiC (YdhE family)
MSNTVFLFPNLTGHLNPTLQIAKEQSESGNKVYYASSMDTMPFAKKHGYEFFAMNSLPFAIGMEDALHDTKKEKWLESLMDRHSGKSYKLRKADIERLVNELDPAVIFLDEFNYSDFILLYSFMEGRRIILLQTKFPMYFSEKVPPLNSYAYPEDNVKWLWRRYFMKRNLKELWSKFKYLGKSDLSILKQKFKENGLPQKYAINTIKVFRPSFNNLEEWFLVKKELDFKEQELLPWQKYIEPVIDLERKEEITEACQKFVEHAISNTQNKLIYCSLGTVLKTHAKGKEKQVLKFFQNLVDLAEGNLNWYFYVVVEKDFIRKLKSKSTNIKLVEYALQIYLLKQADLFITHAGMGSVNEAYSLKVPMLVVPLNKKWDQNGTAARMVYHGYGEKADLKDSKEELKKKIQVFLSELSPLHDECSGVI